MEKKFLFLLTQDDNNDYDTYDSCVVVAKDEEEARQIKPSGADWNYAYSSWASSPDKVAVTRLGEAREDLESLNGLFPQDHPVIIASFNAG